MYKEESQSIVSKSPNAINSIVFYTNSGDDSLAVIRVLGPAKQLGLKIIKGVENTIAHIENVQAGDIVILQRHFCLDLDSYERILSLAHDLHKPVILDLDDLLFELPEDHPDRLSSYFTASLMPMLQAVMEVDLITVATLPLRDYLLPYNKNIVVIPNYLNDSLWHFKDPSSSEQNDDKVIIGYMGGHSHRPDLLLVLPALLKIVEKYPQKVLFQFWGIEPPAELAPFSRVDWYPPRSLDYPDFVAYFLTQAADIMIAPLCDNLFNSCKSPIKFLEYSAFGSPGVYSRVTPYSNIITNRKDGILASSTDEWVRSLSRLIEDQDLRIKIALNAQRKVKRNWLLSRNAEKQLKIYTDATSLYDKLEYSPSPYYRIVKSITRQFHEEQQLKKHQTTEYKNSIKSLTDQIAEHKSTIDSLTGQIDEHNSTIVSLTNQLTEHKSMIDALTGQIVEHKSTIDSLTSQIAEHKSTIASLTDQIVEHKSTIDSLTDQIVEHKSTIDSLTDQIAEHKSTIDSLTDQLAENKSTIDLLTDQLSQSDQNNLMLTTQLAEREEEILSYVVSKSWTLTRPFRILSRKSIARKR